MVSQLYNPGIHFLLTDIHSFNMFYVNYLLYIKNR